MSHTLTHSGLSVDKQLAEFVKKQLLPGTHLDEHQFWKSFANIVQTLTPLNKSLLAKREQLQKQIDDYHLANKNADQAQYQAFLKDIGYLVDEPENFSIETQNVEPEIALTAGPQLVVPVSNARFALNAANARWGSLYDALYGTDVLSEDDGAEKGSQYNPVRGFKVMAYARQFLDKALPLENGSHIESTNYSIVDGALAITLRDSSHTTLKNPEQLIGYQGEAQNPSVILLKNNGLHIELQIDHHHPIGQADKAGLKDVVLEAALTTIMDCEDSVAAVDAEDKVQVYKNWLGLMQGNLVETFRKGDKMIDRTLQADRQYTGLDGQKLTLKGRSMMFVRNVGHLMTNPAITDVSGNDVFEGIMDAMFTATAALHDLNTKNTIKNSTAQSINIVKPKMHGPDEVAFANTLFGMVEEALSLPKNTLKMGIMDEERRTSANLKACIHAAKERVVFINTGFLDRTGDEIHTSMQAGVVLPKAAIKAQPWISAYEDRNVDIGLACGLSHKAQIGKGMWAMPDKMAMMMEQKIAHPQSGANTAWVPSPTAATLHAMHYHDVDVFSLQQSIATRQIASLESLLTPPLMPNPETLSKEDIQSELENNAQGILGYVVRWIDQGIGCSKVPDINHIGLMEDRATLRISSQHIANWLHHGVCSKEQIQKVMAKMAKVVDGQNEHDSLYTPMATNEQTLAKSIAYQAALALVFEGVSQPSGYTEPLLHSYRLKYKAQH
ncbi:MULTISPECIES: malate synthase G [Pseudoalteromonas]|jgi:malate synthase|uniref:Malate synthase G n=1 Tax=Pseudoalteromonas tetraodonis TaxID=43659 RepID=A0ABD4EMP8_9GAMM|nr:MULTISPECIES: malate synthase G [Pseudoalteromonas]KYL33047.1 malate synthase G [Pseudoalteromonas spiralis]MDN3395412.1 malate synthase G [Pseudoalteromonas sp. APC 3215]MDN3400440.1 malate synthase G [Pseudoalteromonas sp. APC 3213]MDN3405653.1 malate synthase G [Pseudoalteromonas sp. APC 3218]MDN3429717.1 malate synthase G [Pseudoalteromonas sp. APC 3907]